MSAYIVFIREETIDKSELETYWQKAPAAIESRPMKALAADGRQATMEETEIEGIVIAEFPSIEEARAWYESPAYQDAAQHRFRGAVYRGYIVESV